MPSIKINFLYKSALTVSTYVIGFITFPYITRVLGVENIGIVNYIDNLTNYFLLFATMGISILGVREISSAGQNNKLRNKVFSNILGLNLIFTFIILAIYLLSVEFIVELQPYKELLYIGIGKIFFTVLLVEWLYTGLEEFRYIAIRSIAIKLLYVVAVFILIKSPEDYKLYFALTVGTIILNAIINIFYALRFIHINIYDLLSIRYLKENFTLGSYLILNSMYSTFNVVFLGLTTNNIQVGYYTTAFKLYSIILAFFSAFTSVMLPRMNALISQNDKREFNRLIKNSFSVVYSFCIPLILFAMTMASDIIYVMAGDGYEQAIIPMMIIMPAVFMVGVSQILAVQIITPLKKDKILLLASISGAALGISLNILLVPRFQSIGTAITLLCSETVVTIVYLGYVLYNKIVAISFQTILKSILYSLPSIVVCLLATLFIDNHYWSLCTGFILGGGLWLAINYHASSSPIKSIISGLVK